MSLLGLFQKDTLPVPREKLNNMKRTIRDLQSDNEILRHYVGELSSLTRKQNSELVKLRDKVRVQNNADVAIKAFRMLLRVSKQAEFPSEKIVDGHMKNLDSIDAMLMEREP